jgi:hypothetical protein
MRCACQTAKARMYIRTAGIFLEWRAHAAPKMEILSNLSGGSRMGRKETDRFCGACQAPSKDVVVGSQPCLELLVERELCGALRGLCNDGGRDASIQARCTLFAHDVGESLPYALRVVQTRAQRHPTCTDRVLAVLELRARLPSVADGVSLFQ